MSLQVEVDSRKEDLSKVIESEAPISKGGSPFNASGMQEQTLETRTWWNQFHSAWSDYVHSEEMPYQYPAKFISLADIFPFKKSEDKVFPAPSWCGLQLGPLMGAWCNETYFKISHGLGKLISAVEQSLVLLWNNKSQIVMMRMRTC